ncbi:MAG: nucleotidyltransferase family protein [Sphaerochaetaceae bacterium]|nr:nucleotidyltransferase family protein [Sphaerochaetaceae bacterium]MDD3162661.1 nucleotidyltransferase family protein [Sphaerochaetaceae bacterium]MDD4006901.1 nucleotidyltransferase family protein [Sphaerochaetaceae bacterium]MDD4396136.1 nucleotidyltransferase family protein [Sphaerochaetaceae bacterium]
MKCVVLAAGYATRLYPLTKNFPKPLLKVGSKTVLDWIVEDAAATCPIDGIYIVSNHRFAHFFEDWKAGSRIQCPISVIDDGTETNETRLGAVMDIKKAIDDGHIDDDLMVVAGDNVLEFSLGLFSRYFASKKTTCIMRYEFSPLKGPCKYGVCSCTDDDLVLEMKEKPDSPRSHWAVPPFYIYRREDLGLISEAIAGGCPVDAPGSFIEWLCAKVSVHAFRMPGKRYDIGNIQSYEQVQNDYKGILIH